MIFWRRITEAFARKQLLIIGLFLVVPQVSFAFINNPAAFNIPTVGNVYPHYQATLADNPLSHPVGFWWICTNPSFVSGINYSCSALLGSGDYYSQPPALNSFGPGNFAFLTYNWGDHDGHDAWLLYNVTASSTLSDLTIATSSPACTENCYSNVLFLPGVEASRLYRPDYNGGTEKLWEPGLFSNSTPDLYLNDQGKSIRNDIYINPNSDDKGVIDAAYLPGIGNVYKSFINQMNGLKSAGTINDWDTAPYDWRLSLDDILNSGNQLSDDRIYYGGVQGATSTPYIIQDLRRLAASSKTGKVTIVAHSNGGLVAKALTNKLGSEASKLIDKIIFVAVPEVGTPEAAGALLHGFDQGLPTTQMPYALDPQTARTFASTTPATYNLLPSANYFTYVDNPVVTFDKSDILADFRARYGNEIHSADRLANFITDTWRLASSSPSDLDYPAVGNAGLLSNANAVHNTLDAWVPPQGVPLYEIAGWGEDTLATIQYYQGEDSVCANGSSPSTTCSNYVDIPTIKYTPYEVVDGDGTVVSPSALWTPAAAGVTKYWVDLYQYNNTFPQKLLPYDRKHSDIFEVPQLRNLVNDILVGATSTLPDFITTTKPLTVKTNRLRFTLHSPLNLSAIDSAGNIINYATSTIPGSDYRRYGEVQVITTPNHAPVTLNLDGYASGSFTLDMQEIDGNDSIIASSTIAAVPTSTSTKATIALTDGTIQNASPLFVDYNGDGRTDFTIKPELGKIVTPDLTPPEARLSLSASAMNLMIEGIDDTQTSISTIATSSLLADQGNNTLQITYSQNTQSGHQLNVQIQGLSYNGVSTNELSQTVLQYEWSTDKTGSFKELEELVTSGTQSIQAHYNAKKNATQIQNTTTGDAKTLPGLVILRATTNKGKIILDY